MNKKIDYIVVNAYNQPTLSKKIEEKINDGYELVGGICILLEPNIHYYQAMIKN